MCTSLRPSWELLYTLSEVKTEIFKYLREDDKSWRLIIGNIATRRSDSLYSPPQKRPVIHIIQHEFCSDTWSPTGILLIKHFPDWPKGELHIMSRFMWWLRSTIRLELTFIFPLWHHLSSVKTTKKKSIFTNYFNLYYYNICNGFQM